MSIASDKLMNLGDGQVLYNDLRGRIDGKDVTAPIAPSDTVTAAEAHAVGDVISVGGQLYVVTAAIAIGDTIADGTNVASTTVMAQIAAKIAALIDDTAGDGDTAKVYSADKVHDLLAALCALSNICVASSATASSGINSGVLILLNGVLYKTTEYIVSGSTITPGTNATETTLVAELVALKDKVDGLVNDSGYFENSLVSTFSAKKINEKLNLKAPLNGPVFSNQIGIGNAQMTEAQMAQLAEMLSTETNLIDPTELRNTYFFKADGTISHSGVYSPDYGNSATAECQLTSGETYTFKFKYSSYSSSRVAGLYVDILTSGSSTPTRFQGSTSTEADGNSYFHATFTAPTNVTGIRFSVKGSSTNYNNSGSDLEFGGIEDVMLVAGSSIVAPVGIKIGSTVITEAQLQSLLATLN